VGSILDILGHLVAAPVCRLLRSHRIYVSSRGNSVKRWHHGIPPTALVPQPASRGLRGSRLAGALDPLGVLQGSRLTIAGVSSARNKLSQETGANDAARP